jgi:hypothetical protein
MTRRRPLTDLTCERVTGHAKPTVHPPLDPVKIGPARPDGDVHVLCGAPAAFIVSQLRGKTIKQATCCPRCLADEVRAIVTTTAPAVSVTAL